MSSNSTNSLNSILMKIVSYNPSNLLNFTSPEDLEKDLDDKINNVNGQSDFELEKLIQFILEKCVNTSHSMFVNQMYGGANPVGLAAAYIVEKMNTCSHTFEAAPVFVLTEKIVLRKLRLLFFGSEEGDGLFSPGGSIANMYGLVSARTAKFPKIKVEGLYGIPPLVVFTSEDAHYSVSKTTNWMGLGVNNVIKVKTSENGSMLISELEAEIEKCKTLGKIPFVVVATSGTTVLDKKNMLFPAFFSAMYNDENFVSVPGAFDPLVEIADICKRENIWLHCDAAWGGSFIFSEKLKAKWLQGIEKCDSICWNAHKMLGAPLQCSVFLTKVPNILSTCNAIKAPYLFQANKHYSGEYDESGDKSVQCGRKADAFKLWLMWVSMGQNGFKKTIENTEDCARYFAEQLRKNDEFLLYSDTYQCTNVFFWYIPSLMRKQEKTKEWWSKIDKVTTEIKRRLLLQDKVMIGYAPLTHKNVPNAFRLVLTAYPEKTHDDMDTILKYIINEGKIVANDFKLLV